MTSNVTPIFDHAHSIIVKVTFSFPEFVPACRKISSSHHFIIEKRQTVGTPLGGCFREKKEVQVFPIERERLAKFGVGCEGGGVCSFKKGVSLIFILTLSSDIFPSKCLVWLHVFCLFTRFLPVLFVFHRKNLVLYYLINRCITFTSE